MNARTILARAALPALGLALLAGSAQAHTGHAEAGLAAGMLHPLTGADHLLALLGVGFWAARARRRSVPAAFLAAFAGGIALAGAGLALPFIEPGVLASVLLVGALIAMEKDLPAWLAVAAAALFALPHGFAHGAELAGPALAGALAVSAALLAAGWAAARLLERGHRWVGLAGVAAALGLSLS